MGLVTMGAGDAVGGTYGGRWTDRWGTRRILVLATAVSALVGTLWGWMSVQWLTVSAALVLGCSLGTLATSSLAGMMQRVPADGYGRISAAWNINFDLGIALGGVLIGVIVVLTGFTGAIIACATALGVVAVVGVIGLKPTPAVSQS